MIAFEEGRAKEETLRRVDAIDPSKGKDFHIEKHSRIRSEIHVMKCNIKILRLYCCLKHAIPVMIQTFALTPLRLETYNRSHASRANGRDDTFGIRLVSIRFLFISLGLLTRVTVRAL